MTWGDLTDWRFIIKHWNYAYYSHYFRSKQYFANRWFYIPQMAILIRFLLKTANICPIQCMQIMYVCIWHLTIRIAFKNTYVCTIRRMSLFFDGKKCGSIVGQAFVFVYRHCYTSNKALFCASVTVPWWCSGKIPMVGGRWLTKAQQAWNK